MYVVRTGRLDVIDEKAGTVLRSLGRGDVVGELALITASTRSASVRAARASDLISIERESFDGAFACFARALAGAQPGPRRTASAVTRAIADQPGSTNHGGAGGPRCWGARGTPRPRLSGGSGRHAQRGDARRRGDPALGCRTGRGIRTAAGSRRSRPRSRSSGRGRHHRPRTRGPSSAFSRAIESWPSAPAPGGRGCPPAS